MPKYRFKVTVYDAESDSVVAIVDEPLGTENDAIATAMQGLRRFDDNKEEFEKTHYPTE